MMVLNPSGKFKDFNQQPCRFGCASAEVKEVTTLPVSAGKFGSKCITLSQGGPWAYTSRLPPRRMPFQEECNLRGKLSSFRGDVWKHGCFPVIFKPICQYSTGHNVWVTTSGSFWKILVECRPEYISMRCWQRPILGAYRLMAVVVKSQVLTISCKLFPACSNGF